MKSTLIDAWFPDYVARWYDEFQPQMYEAVVDDWRNNTLRAVERWTLELLVDPHATAKEIDGQIEKGFGEPRELRFRALQAASAAFEKAGVVQVINYGGTGWSDIRAHWRLTGKLLRNGDGVLLPRRVRPFAWQRPRVEPKQHDIRSLFGGFLRWRPTPTENFEIEVTVLPDSRAPWESLETCLRVAVVPLVEAANDFHWIPLDAASGRRAYRVNLEDPHGTAMAACKALEKAAVERCDIVLFPELCLTVDGQSLVKKELPSISGAHGGRPWLVVAGSAHTPVIGSPNYHNRTLVFDGQGRQLLSYHKLHIYEMSAGEESKYGIADALDGIPRVEDIICSPRKIALLESPIGRVAVLICEDLSVTAYVELLVGRLEVDWLLVPILDGAQKADRWASRHSVYFAGEGASVVVGTSMSLVEAHRASEKAKGKPDPGRGASLLALPNPGSAPNLLILDHLDNHAIPLVYEVKAT